MEGLFGIGFNQSRRDLAFHLMIPLGCSNLKNHTKAPDVILEGFTSSGNPVLGIPSFFSFLNYVFFCILEVMIPFISYFF